MAHAVGEIGLEPVGVVEPLRIGLEFRVGPAGQGGAQFLLRVGDALVARDRRMAAGEIDFGLVVERAQKRALPAVPHARPDGANVADGQHEKQLQPFQRLHDAGEALDRLRVGEIAALRGVRHREMFENEPGDGFRLGLGKSEARAQVRAPRARRRSNDPRRGPWRCRAGTARHKAPCGCEIVGRISLATGWSSTRRPPSMSQRMPIERIRCSSTV